MEDTCSICRVGTLKTLPAQPVVVMNANLVVKSSPLIILHMIVYKAQVHIKIVFKRVSYAPVNSPLYYST